MVFEIKIDYSSFNNDKIPYFQDFLNRYSESSKKHYKTKVIYFKVWLEKNRNITNIINAKYEDFVALFNEDINKRDISNSSKNHWRIYLNSYYSFIGKIYKKKGAIFINPVPDSDLYNFNIRKEVFIEDLFNSERYIEYEDAERILSYCYYVDYQMFIIVGFLLYTGARITEIMSLLEKNINLEHRLIFNFIKRAKFNIKYGVYFFPEFFVKHLELYIANKNEAFPSNPFVFPSRQKRVEYISIRTIQIKLDHICSILNITAKHNPHAFRKCINIARKKRGVAPLDRTILLNHTPKSVEAKHYLPNLEEIQSKKEIYDKTFPFPELKINKIK